jgi:hypothetical protein
MVTASPSSGWGSDRAGTEGDTPSTSTTASVAPTMAVRNMTLLRIRDLEESLVLSDPGQVINIM